MLDDCYRTAYTGADCVTVRDKPPATRDVRGSARAHLHVRLDEHRQTITAVCVIDNLLKGASSQAVQNFNVSKGLLETEGLPLWPQTV